jgi:4-hydroxybenzoate polyprenyltransferase
MLVYLRLMRPADWIKNLFVFAALAFGNKIGDPHAVKLALLAFVVFCLASSAGYAFNDLLDHDRDRHHPLKRTRPIASGQVSPAAAVILIALILGTAALLSLSTLSSRFSSIVAMYIVLSVSYSLALKHRMLLDVITIATLFVLRAVGGAIAIGVTVSPWLLVCTFMLCLFLGFGKRRCEIATINDADAMRDHRPTLVRYTPDLLNHLLSTSGGIAIVTFMLYTVDTSKPSPVNKHNLIYTLPLVIYGIYRYAMLVELGKATGPTDLVINDRPFLITILLWILAAILILYGKVPGQFLGPA